jgi:succinoglycan biosynthesis protein ExoM
MEHCGACYGTHIARDRTKTAALAVTVCICTFRRASVLDAVKSVLAQQLPAGAAVEILVIDNDDTPTARAIIADYVAATGNVVRYLHVTGRNISIARNAALDAVTAPWLAFLDDDEQASPGWLRGLLSAHSGANAVFGPCVALYAPATPAWIRAGDYHSNRIPDGQNPIISGYTSNVLIDVGFVRRHGLRFEPSLGRTGGEDTVFFYTLCCSGGILRYAPNAIVFEHVVPARLNLRWIVVRRYRAGQVYAMMFHCFDRARYWTVISTAPLKVGACACASVAFALTPRRAMWWLMRGLFHLGALSFALGARLYEEYSSEERPRMSTSSLSYTAPHYTSGDGRRSSSC